MSSSCNTIVDSLNYYTLEIIFFGLSYCSSTQFTFLEGFIDSLDYPIRGFKGLLFNFSF